MGFIDNNGVYNQSSYKKLSNFLLEKDQFGNRIIDYYIYKKRNMNQSYDYLKIL